jgi:pantoate--beta-alanine ligase
MVPIVHTSREVRLAVSEACADDRQIGFVPTMGALHSGHVSLMDRCRADDCYTIISIYVNPTQFGPNEDFQKYPRTLTADAAICTKAGADLIFAPDTAEMYPPGDQTRIRPGLLADTLCGPFRPGHFEGVCTVVAKLFNIVQPDRAYFGQKDAQQAVIIRRMAADLQMPVEIVTCPLIRDADGLALSSRNARLDPVQRAQSVALFRCLCGGRDLLLRGELSMGSIIAHMRAILARAGITHVDYLSIVDPDDLSNAELPTSRVMIAGAVRIGEVRLIDNIIVDLPAARS